MRLIVAGSRSITDRRTVWDGLDHLLPHTMPDQVISGTAPGPDTFGLWWAVHHGIRVREMPADWGRYGRRAGYVRNSEMAQAATHLAAFWDMISRGTMHMIALAEKADLTIRTIHRPRS